jgi:F-type H+-transporting ATPase subunit b
MMNKNFVAALKPFFASAVVALLPVLAFAQEHGGEHGGGHGAGHEAGLPTVVYLQAFNFVLYAGVLFYFLRKPVKSYFSGRGVAFNEALVKAKAAKEEAEAKKREVAARLGQLSSTAEQQVAQAKADAEALRVRILKDAEDISRNLRNEAARTAEFEVERAKNELRQDLLNQSVALSSKILQERMAEGDQKRLQTEFVDKIGANR